MTLPVNVFAESLSADKEPVGDDVIPLSSSVSGKYSLFESICLTSASAAESSRACFMHVTCMDGLVRICASPMLGHTCDCVSSLHIISANNPLLNLFS